MKKKRLVWGSGLLLHGSDYCSWERVAALCRNGEQAVGSPMGGSTNCNDGGSPTTCTDISCTIGECNAADWAEHNCTEGTNPSTGCFAGCHYWESFCPSGCNAGACVFEK